MKGINSVGLNNAATTGLARLRPKRASGELISELLLGRRRKSRILSGARPERREWVVFGAAGVVGLWFVIVGAVAQGTELFATGIILLLVATASVVLPFFVEWAARVVLIPIRVLAWLLAFFLGQEALSAVFSPPDPSNPSRPFLALFVMLMAGGAEVLQQMQDDRARRADVNDLLSHVEALECFLTELRMRAVKDASPRRVGLALRRMGEDDLADRAEFLAHDTYSSIAAEVAHWQDRLGDSLDARITAAVKRRLKHLTSVIPPGPGGIEQNARLPRSKHSPMRSRS